METTINCRHSVGDHVFAVDFNQHGAWIFDGRIDKILVIVGESAETFYNIGIGPMAYFPEDSVFGDRESAEKARSEWISGLERVQQEEDQSILPYRSSCPRTDTRRITLFRTRREMCGKS